VPLSWNLANLTPWDPLGHSRPVTGLLYLYVTVIVAHYRTNRSTILHIALISNISSLVRKYGQYIFLKSGPLAIVTTDTTITHGSELNKIHPAGIMFISRVFVLAMLTLFLKAGAPPCLPLCLTAKVQTEQPAQSSMINYLILICLHALMQWNDIFSVYRLVFLRQAAWKIPLLKAKVTSGKQRPCPVGQRLQRQGRCFSLL